MFHVNQSAGFLLGSLAKKTAARFLQLMQSEKIDIGLSGWIVLSRIMGRRWTKSAGNQ
jgi:hypothetical protein